MLSWTFFPRTYGFSGPTEEIIWFTGFFFSSFHVVKVTATQTSQTHFQFTWRLQGPEQPVTFLH